MPFYKDTNNKVHYLDNIAFSYLLPSGCTPITPEEAEALRSTVLPNLVPLSVSRFQARAALAQAGYLTSVVEYMETLPVDHLMRLAWNDATEFDRASPTVAAMAQILNLTDEQIDALFVTAMGIKA